MSDEASNDPETPDQDQEQEPQGDPADKPLGENGEKALKAERTARAAAEKERDALKAELDEIGQANETEIEKAQREAQEARAEVDKIPSLVAGQLRSHLVDLHEISEEDSELFLTSQDPEVLLKQVARLVSANKPSTAPRPDLSQGGTGTKPAGTNADRFAEAFADRF